MYIIYYVNYSTVKYSTTLYGTVQYSPIKYYIPTKHHNTLNFTFPTNEFVMAKWVECSLSTPGISGSSPLDSARLRKEIFCPKTKFPTTGITLKALPNNGEYSHALSGIATN